MKFVVAAALIGLAACGSSHDNCMGPSGPTKLIEGYCANGEAADRCYFDHDPMDGF